MEPYTNLAVKGHPDIISVGNTGGLLETADFRNGAAFWYTDRAYAPDCNAVTMLYCVHAPATGGETMFADFVAAYADLDTPTRDEMAGRICVHRYGGGEREDWEFAVHRMNDDQAKGPPTPGRRPIARTRCDRRDGALRTRRFLDRSRRSRPAGDQRSHAPP